MVLPDFIQKLISDIAVRESLIDYTLETDAGSKHGDNFQGVMVAVRLVGSKDVNGKFEKVTKHLLCKIPPSSSIRRNVYQSIFAFEREVKIYSKVLPIFDMFQEEKGLTREESFNSYPVTHVALCDEENDHHILIMDDLRHQNFVMFPKEQSTNIEHATLVMKEMAKYHAVSFALKDQQPQLFEEFKESDVLLNIIKNGKVKAVVEESLDRCFRVVKNANYKKSIADMRERYIEILENYASDEFIGDSAIVTHGDCWNNNFLFSYKENEEYKNPSSVIFLDWQLSRYGPPVYDIFYFIFTATDKSFRDKHYRNLLNVYHSTLSTSIEKLGSDPMKLYPFDQLENDLKRYGRFGLIFAAILIQFCVAQGTDVADIDAYCEKLEKGENCSLMMDFDDNKSYQKRMTDVVEDLFQYGYID